MATLEKGLPIVPTWEGGTWSLGPDLLQPLGAADEGLLVGHIIDETQDIGTLPLSKRQEKHIVTGTLGMGRNGAFREAGGGGV